MDAVVWRSSAQNTHSARVLVNAKPARWWGGGRLGGTHDARDACNPIRRTRSQYERPPGYAPQRAANTRHTRNADANNANALQRPLLFQRLQL